MARCPYLEYIGSEKSFFNNDDNYLCKETGQTMDFNSAKVKYTCDADYGDCYKDCPYYKNSR